MHADDLLDYGMNARTDQNILVKLKLLKQWFNGIKKIRCVVGVFCRGA